VEGVRRGRDKQERILAADRNVSTGQPLTEAEKDKRRQDNLELFAAETNVTALRNRVEAERLGVKALDADPVEANVTAAEGEAAAARGLVAEAEAAADACLIRARVAGTVEQLDAAPGASYGPANRTPLLLLVPSGGRVVRAEVDPEFAYRIDGKVGAAVTVTDFTNTALTYKGVVRRVGKAFVPKPSAAGGLAGLDPPKALICVIDLPDPAPAGKPPLRVNQPVRVVFPQ
jgi:multidrug resistance efflux pump